MDVQARNTDDREGKSETGTGTIPDDPSPRWIGVERTLRAATVAGLLLLVAVAATGWLGVRTTVARVDAQGVDVSVEHARIARPGLSAPVVITIRSRGDLLPETLIVEVPTDYLAAYEVHAVHPAPARESSDGVRVQWEMTVPAGSTVTSVLVAARIDAAASGRRSGDLRVHLEGRASLSVPLDTWLLP
jgi:hypothetical protein